MSWIPRDMARRVTVGAFWSYAGVFCDRAMRFVVFLYVARLVSPPAFGSVMASLLAVEALQALFNLGLPTVLLQQETAPKPMLDTAFLINLAMSVLVAGALFMAAAPLVAILKAPAAAAVLLRWLAFTPPIAALGSVHVALIQRDLGFKALAVRQAVSSLGASVVAVLMAAAGLGVWALVARALMMAIFGTALAWAAISYRPRFGFDWPSARGAAKAGLKLWAAGLATVVNSRGFDLLAGVALGAAALGALRIAGQTIMLLIEMTAGPMLALGFALLSRARREGAGFEQALSTMARLTAGVMFPAFAGLYVVADILMPLLFGPRWSPAVPITPYMCVIAPALYFQVLISAALFAAGRNDRLLTWAVLEAALTAALGVAAARFGLVGLAVAGTLRLYLMMPLGWRWLRRDLGIGPMALIAPALPCSAASLVMAVVVAFAKSGLAGALAPAPLTIALILIGIAAYGLSTPFTMGELWRWAAEGKTREAEEAPLPSFTEAGVRMARAGAVDHRQ